MNGWQPYSPCPCGCSATAHKLSVKTGHVLGCACHSCIGIRNQRKGKRGQANAHRHLRGEGFTPSNEESGRAYSVEVRIEAKKGAQVPAHFVRVIESEWFRHAMSQATRGTPIGEQSNPSVYLEPAGGGAYLIVELHPRRGVK